MAIWNEKFYKGTDVYSDGSIEEDILDIVCRNDYKVKKDELIGNNYTLAYHLSPIRENVLNWYPFTKEESAIEIGAGCGAITGMLCEKLGKVVSVDLSKRRSKINYERHKEYDNLEIIIGNFNDVELSEKYDYVVLNGVFEYAISFTDAEKPYHEFLKHISRFLKPSGKFLISIENKLGLKYFNGAKEDHTGNYFLGLNDYVGNETVRTFSKTEIKDILADEGFAYTQFYYPYPDYKFPNEVFTDESIETNQYGRPYINIENDRYWLFNEYTVGKTLIKEKVRDIFANSFIVEACREDFNSQVIYAKLNVERKEVFQIGTTICENDKQKSVIKYALNPEAKKHIDRIYETTGVAGKKVSYLSAHKDAGVLKFEYLYSKNLDAQIVDLIKKRDVVSIEKIVKEFMDAYLEEFTDIQEMSTYHNDIFKTFFGDQSSEKTFLCVKNANIDVIMDNIYLSEGNYILIDGEWLYPEWIPYAFIKWRAINELYAKHKELEQLIARKDIMKEIGILSEDEELFIAWATYFAREYVGSSQREQWAKETEFISIDEIHQKNQVQKMLSMSLYIDTGDGFSEESKVYQDVVVKDGYFQVTFSSERFKGAKQLRFDPLEMRLCSVEITEVSSGVEIIRDNAYAMEDNARVFMNYDPQIYMNMDVENSSVTIKGKIRILQEDVLLKFFNNSLANIQRNEEIIKQNTEKIRNREVVIESLMRERDEYASLANSTKAFLKRKVKLKLESFTKK